MKLAILAQSYLHDATANINGTLVQQHNLAHGLKTQGVEVHYIATTKDHSKPSHTIEDGIQFHWIHAQQGLFEWKRQFSLYKNRLESLQPDALYVRGRNVLQYVAGNFAKRHNIPYVWGTNGEDSAELWKNIKRLKVSNKSFLKKVLLFPVKAIEDTYINKGMKMSDVIVNQSIHQQAETKRILKKEGLVLPSYFYVPEHQNVPKENTLLWLANLYQAKQPEIFIEAIKRLNLNDWKAILAGGTSDANYFKTIKNLASETSIELPGKIAFKDSFGYFQNAKIYVNTSRPNADGLPNAFIQSWLSGTVVCSLHHDPNYWMRDHQIGFCANGDIDIFVSNIQALLDDQDKLSEMSNKAKTFGKTMFASDKTIEHYIRLFKG